MRPIRRVFRLGLLRRRDVTREVDEELAFHLAMRAARLSAGGMPSDDAARLAEQRFGDLEAIREECVEESQRLAMRERIVRTLDEAAQDTRYAFRSLLRAKRFTLAVVITLALGIGVNVTVFSLIDAVVMRPVTGVSAPEELFGLLVRVARDALYHQLNEEPRPYLYFAHSDVRQDMMLVRVAGDAAAMSGEVVRTVRSAAPGVPVVSFGTVEDRLREVLAPQLAGAWLLGGFGVLSLLIAVVGIYGVLAYGVERRTREIGIRMAVGARATDVLRAVAIRALMLVAGGVVVGLLLGAGLVRGARSFLFGVPFGDPVAVGAAVGVMLSVGLLAAWAPARRAVRIDPSTALRTDA